MSETLENTGIYQFGPFLLIPKESTLKRNGKLIKLQPKSFEILVFLVENRGRLLERDEIIGSIWLESFVEPGNLTLRINQIRNALGDNIANPQYIETIPTRGYRFIAQVDEIQAEEISTPKAVIDEKPATPNLTTDLTTPVLSLGGSGIRRWVEALFGGYHWQAITTSFMYATLYAVALLVEVAYEFDQFKDAVWRNVLVVFCWIFTTALVGFATDRTLLLRGNRRSLLLSFLVFLFSAAILFLIVRPFLPTDSVTDMSSQSQPAQAAYLLREAYFLVLCAIFMLPTFHFILAMKHQIQKGECQSVLGLLTGDKFSITPPGVLFIKSRVLIGLLVLMTGYASISYFVLISQLEADPHRNLFSILFTVRVLLYLSIAAQCCVWYSRALEDLKRTCLGHLT